MSRRCLPLISVLLFTQYSFLNLFNTISSLEELILVCRTSFEFLRFPQICFSSAGIATFSYMRTSDCCLTARSFNVTDLIDIYLISILKKVRLICVCHVLEYNILILSYFLMKQNQFKITQLLQFTGLPWSPAASGHDCNVYRCLQRTNKIFDKFGQKSL